MNTNKRCLLMVLLWAFSSIHLSAQNSATTKPDAYKNEMQVFQSAIQKNFYDKASGYYFLEIDPATKERKNGYLRNYTYLLSLCAMYQAANEIEKIEPNAKLMGPLLQIMNDYYDEAPPRPGYSDYIMKVHPGERYYDDNQWIGITALDAYERTKEKSNLDLGKRMYDFMMCGYNSVLGGGLYWKETSKSSKNTCSNGPGILVALQMFQATKNTNYLNVALALYKWTNEKLQQPSGLYYDSIQTKDGSINRATWSYNTGTMLEANVYLYELTGDEKYLKEANSLDSGAKALLMMILAVFKIPKPTGAAEDPVFFGHVVPHGYETMTC